jgi:7-cyano-7-deazaguanine synthase
MCGIAGALVYETRAARLDRLVAAIDVSASRGQDSFGVVRWSPSTGFRRFAHVGPARSPVSSSPDGQVGTWFPGWLDAVGFPERDEPTIFLHTSRAEPTTEWVRHKTDADVPPFVADGVAVAHNGILANDGALERAYGIDRLSMIDTAVIPPLVARNGVWRTIASLRGGAALAIFDSRSERLVLCRNFMPLVLTWEPGIICFASEAAFFPGARDPFPPFHLWELPPFSTIELSVDGFAGPFAWGQQPELRDPPDWRPFPALEWSH